MGLDRLLYAPKGRKVTGHEFLHGYRRAEAHYGRHWKALAKELELKEEFAFVSPVLCQMILLPPMYAAAGAFVLPTAELECFGLIAGGIGLWQTGVGYAGGRYSEVVGRFWRDGWRRIPACMLSQVIIGFLRGALPSHDPAA